MLVMPQPESRTKHSADITRVTVEQQFQSGMATSVLDDCSCYPSESRTDGGCRIDQLSFRAGRCPRFSSTTRLSSETAQALKYGVVTRRLFLVWRFIQRVGWVLNELNAI